jgi:hypothetical protein
VQAPGTPLAEESLDTAAGASGCDVAKVGTERPARYLDCDLFSAFLWVADAELAEAVEWLAEDEDEDTAGQLLAWQILFAEGYGPTIPPIPSLDEPIEMEGMVPIADTLMDAVEEASDGLVWTPAFPPGGANA